MDMLNRVETPNSTPPPFPPPRPPSMSRQSHQAFNSVCPLDLPHHLSTSDIQTDPDDGWDSCTTYDSDATEFRFSASDDEQIRGLGPARILAASGIAIIVWGRDALAFAHHIPGGEVFSHLLVEDQALLVAAGHLSLLGYFASAPHPVLSDFTRFPSDDEPPYQASILLRHVSVMKAPLDPIPHAVLLTPMSYYHVDVSWCENPSLTTSLPRPEVNRTLRFPTWAGHLDSLITTYLEPRHDRNQWFESNLRIDISSLIWAQVRKKDRSGRGQLTAAELAVCHAVSKENRRFVKRKVVHCVEGCWEQWRNERRRILSGLFEDRGCGCRLCAETESVG